MRYWKVILATVVIFVAGAITGVLVFTQVDQTKAVVASPSPSPANRSVAPRSVVWPASSTPVPTTNIVHWNILKTNFLQHVGKQLDLTPEQRERIEVILSESQKRTKELSDLMTPKIKEEVRRAQERMRAELTPEQRRTYDRLYKSRPARKAPVLVHATPAPSNAPSPVLPLK